MTDNKNDTLKELNTILGDINFNDNDTKIDSNLVKDKKNPNIMKLSKYLKTHTFLRQKIKNYIQYGYIRVNGVIQKEDIEIDIEKDKIIITL